jgi:tRNA(Ile)-lysidine synthase
VHKLAQCVLAYIRKQELMRPGDRAGVAVSGGADSVALLRLMLELKDELGIVLSVVHFNHKLRGAESDADEKFVRNLAEGHGLEFARDGCDAKAYASAKKLSLEAAARELRYGFFRRLMQAELNRLATAHTQDDQAETVLLKLVRGAGTRGLAGIYPRVSVTSKPSDARPTKIRSETKSNSRDYAIVRPLLAISRSRLREYLAEIRQDWREDASNQDLRHARNRIRHEIIPQLERELNPAACNVLAEAAEVARAEEQYWSSETSRVLPELWNGDRGVLSRKLLRELPLALQRRVVRAAAESFGFALEFRHVQEILELGCEGDLTSLNAGWIVTLGRNELHFAKAQAKESAYEYPLSVPGQVVVGEVEIKLETVVVNASGEERYSPEHLVDPGLVQNGVVVRNWRPGEQFWPAHTKEPRKIKELLQDRHITGNQKKLWPVVASGDEIIWMRGFGVRRDVQAKGARGVLIREVEKTSAETAD